MLDHPVKIVSLRLPSHQSGGVTPTPLLLFFLLHGPTQPSISLPRQLSSAGSGGNNVTSVTKFAEDLLSFVDRVFSFSAVKAERDGMTGSGLVLEKRFREVMRNYVELI